MANRDARLVKKIAWALHPDCLDINSEEEYEKAADQLIKWVRSHDERIKSAPHKFKDNLPEIIKQLERCGFTCQAGPLENNIAFIELKQMASKL